MSDFSMAIKTVLKHEGGFVNDPDDPGGATNYGVSLRFLVTLGDLDGDGFLEGDLDRDGDVDADDIRKMQRTDAERIYRLQFWDRYGYSHIEAQDLATKVFDLAVNMGPKQAHLLLQRALRAVGHRVTEDGVIGPQTRSTANQAPADCLLAALRSEAAGFYRLLNRPKYLQGWLNRAYA